MSNISISLLPGAIIYCGLFRCRKDGVTYYFIDNEHYFARPDLYGYYDDGERFAYFSRSGGVAAQPSGLYAGGDPLQRLAERRWCRSIWRTTRCAGMCCAASARCSPCTISSIRAATAARRWKTCSVCPAGWYRRRHTGLCRGHQSAQGRAAYLRRGHRRQPHLCPGVEICLFRPRAGGRDEYVRVEDSTACSTAST